MTSHNVGNRSINRRLLCYLFFISFFIGGAFARPHATFRLMKGFPDTEAGYAQGVSACFAGTIDRYLVIAGGCNFPDVPHDKGGKKKYYSGIYAAHIGGGSKMKWQKVGELPVATAYGVSVSLPAGLVIIGGNNEKGALASVYIIRWSSKANRGKQAQLFPLPSLPHPMDNMTGCRVGNTIVVAGGNESGRASCSAFSLDLSNPDAGWKTLPSFPGAPRVQPVSSAMSIGADNSFLIWGGFRTATDEHPAYLSTDGFRYSFTDRRWFPLSAPINARHEVVFLGGAAAVTLSDSTNLAIGGVNKSIFEAALNHPDADYLTHPTEWYKFNSAVLLYHAQTASWQEVGNTPISARAGAALAVYKKDIFLIGGETKPGIRTPSVYRIRIKR